MSPSPVHTVVLVGFMGSGKSIVGRLTARALGWEFLDVDDLVEARTGRSVQAIFEEDGEARFRELEEEAGREALSSPRRVVAPGGGWAVPPGRLEDLPTGVLSVWLQVSPETAVARAGEGERTRPLLEVDAPVARARALLEERSPRYAAADLHLDAEGTTPDVLAERIVEAVRASARAASVTEAPGMPGDAPTRS